MRQFENNPPPDDVADAVLDALSSDNPKMRYLVVPAANQGGDRDPQADGRDRAAEFEITSSATSRIRS